MVGWAVGRASSHCAPGISILSRRFMRRLLRHLHTRVPPAPITCVGGEAGLYPSACPERSPKLPRQQGKKRSPLPLHGG